MVPGGGNWDLFPRLWFRRFRGARSHTVGKSPAGIGTQFSNSQPHVLSLPSGLSPEFLILKKKVKKEPATALPSLRCPEMLRAGATALWACKGRLSLWMPITEAPPPPREDQMRTQRRQVGSPRSGLCTWWGLVGEGFSLSLGLGRAPGTWGFRADTVQCITGESCAYPPGPRHRSPHRGATPT